jgi:membrane peptidoglycan carboxypeptidase
LIGLYPIFSADNDANRYVSLHTSQVPMPWWNMVVFLEDRNIDKWYHVNGIDSSQFVKVPIEFFMSLFSELRGGSSLVMQLAKTMQRDTSKGFLRKIRDFTHAPAIHFYLKWRDPGALKSWYATHVPLMSGNEHGLVHASQILFGKQPDELRLSEQAILAAAVKHHIYPYNLSSWRRVIDRGIYALTNLAAISNVSKDSARSAIAELRSFTIPTLGLAANVQNACLGTNASARTLQLAGFNVKGRTNKLALSEIIEANAEMRDLYGNNWWHQVQSLTLTLGIEDNCELRRAIASEKQRLFKALSQTQANAGVPSDKNIVSLEKNNQIYTAVSLTDKTGAIRAFYGQPYYPFYHGYSLSQDRYRREQEDRKIGSIGKVLAAILAANEGDKPDSIYYELARNKYIGLYPNQKVSAFQNWDGSTGYSSKTDPAAAMTATRAFATSNNLALIERMGRVKSPQLAHVAKDFGFSTPEGRSLTSQVDYTIDLPMGNVFGSARSIEILFRAVAKNIFGLEDDFACAPHIVASYVDIAGERIGYQDQSLESICNTVANYFPPETHHFIEAVLSSVVERDEQGIAGSASSALGTWNRTNQAIDWHIAKTGTTSSAAGSTTGKSSTFNAMIGGALSVNGEPFSYTVQIGPRGQNNRGLGPRVYGGQSANLLRPVIGKLVSNLIEEP